ncbi:zinc finger protein 687b-like isoform X1 [Coregonus clupeaformis]|uniref:zinc finger protein 687b-like isoform X1 n=1 Tax=Coregonus clupeaformis TaxID=59861 RepID=UPI001BDFBEBB|nr:zinc finger protein 687b-like isoform X1 [Coregonus clupeaformis]
MGDMKTPDFDDLLAAFDIPDIDAKEAIQSAPEEGGEGSGKAGGSVSGAGGPSPRPSSPTDSPPNPQSEPPVVSVIVKNRVRPDSYEDTEGSDEEDGESPGGSGTDPDPEVETGMGVKGSLLNSRLAPRMPSLVSSEPLLQNGFEGSTATLEPSVRGQGMGQANRELWSTCSPSTASEGRGSSGGAGGSASTTKHTVNILNRLKPLPSPHTSAGPITSTSSSSSSSSLSVNPHLSPPSILSEDTPRPPRHLSSPPPSNGRMRRIMDSDEDDSEPDLGSPLVIQESPDSPMCSPPKFPRRHRQVSSSELFSSPTPSSPPLLSCPPPLSSKPPPSITLTSSNSKPPPPDEVPSTPRSPSPPPAQPRASQSWLAAALSNPRPISSPVMEERNPEHVIEERDSPESPPPDQTGSAMSTVPKMSSSPAPASASTPQGAREEEEPMESEPTLVSRSEDSEKMEVVDGRQTGDTETAPANAMTTPTAPVRPLKVRIKTVKTPTGSITRTVTRVASKGAGGTPSKGTDSSKPSPGGRKVLSRPKRVASQQPPQQKSKGGSLLPVSTLQDASTAMLMAASKAQNKMAADSNKPKVSATAVSITKSAALPSVSSASPRFSPGGASVRSLGQKTLNGGVSVSPSPLLPPQGGSRPASIVNSTGAIISRSQSSLVEAFNKILNSKNLLPSYRPDLSTPLPPEWDLPLPAQGYRCLECGDAFALERSLARHYDRRSLRIEVTCNHCAKRLAFFNKCSLLLHAREHKERGLVMQCSHLVMRPVTVEQMIGQQDTTPIGMLSPSLSTSSVLASSSPAVTSAVTPATLSPAPQLQQPVPNKKAAEPVLYTNNKCPECKVQFCSKAEVAAHFQEVKPALNTSCTECSPPMLLPNGCSASAHARIHNPRPPYVCPECGGVAKQPAFQSHLEEACLHFTRRIGYRCSSCQVVFGGLNSVKSHIQTAHCEVFHKCPSCPMAFKSSPSAQSHINTQHPTLTGGQAKMIYKCVMCDTVFTQKPLLYVHFDTHLVKQKVHVFKCPECTKLYAQRSSMLEHIKTTHRGPAVKQEVPVAMAPSPAPLPRVRSSAKTESSDGEEWGREEEEEEEKDGESSKTSPGWSCAPCHARYADREDYITHMAEQHGKILKKFPCSLCESSFSSTSSLRRHIRVKHKGIKRAFHCRLCTEGKRTFSSRLVLERHVQLRHSMSALDTKKRGRGAEGADSSSEQDGGSNPPFTVSAEEDGGGGVKTEEEEEDVTEGIIPAKRPRVTSSAPPPQPESGFHCAPCGFTTEDRAVFLEHIPQHRSEALGGGVSLQCLQCGACFASAPSLSRHRFISHRVRDTPPDNHSRHAHNDRSLTSSPGNGGNHGDGSPRGGSLPGSPSSSSHPPTPLGEDGEGRVGCKVCGKRFDKVSDLNTHFRTHGMAFITARKTDKPV